MGPFHLKFWWHACLRVVDQNHITNHILDVSIRVLDTASLAVAQVNFHVILQGRHETFLEFGKFLGKQS